ncbi:ABC transporter [Sulfurifustis variabilis]|uniref:ABC transporter n=1 Tax=Sulfurifustis variabilis TaxID=1675686 RepID=A0A1B4V8H1_9GAMM|nr:VacJ family lipoprotein [Sulfurifustis variabilis]BAU48932.1 ABC transporter [Sulfurifustis variabilis]
MRQQHTNNGLGRGLACLVLLFALLPGCATTARDGDAPASYDAPENADPLEPFNRAMYTFNDKFDRYLLKPVAKGYRAVMPAPVRRGVSNFFANLTEPLVALNSALQGKWSDAGSDLGRFATNTTLGLFGLFDVATRFGLERHNEDFGQTFGVWGVGEGPYLVLPFLGPSNFRDGFGLIPYYYAHPVTYMEEQSTAYKLYALEAVDTRARLLDAGDILDQAAGEDPYVFVREAYLQRRRNLVADGAAPTAVDPAILFEEEQPPAPPNGGS